ncbi:MULTISPECIES: oligosaccharide flippase family protein [Natrialbaceae]|uniref:oligosaccharide flippase family protein n=1 Tax=Natrialbaceae TaxID=1644061 RepID=UPI00207C3EBB|nr:polysaccharide biosynthesis C-terminal domain-containing protein [Natronococcus sp. CG52]
MDIVKSSFKVLMAKTAGALLTFVGTVIFARELGATALGIFFLFQAALGVLAVPADFGLRTAVEKRLSEGQTGDQIFTAGIILKTVPLGAVSVGIIAFQGTINAYLGAPLAMYLVLTLILQELADFSLRLLRGELRVGETWFLQFIRDAGWVVVGIPLLVLGFDVYALVYGLLVGFTVTFVWGMHKTSLAFQQPAKLHVDSLVSYAKFDVFSGVGKQFYSRMDLLVIAIFLPKAAVSSYEIAWLITMVVILTGESVAVTIFPQVSEWSAQKATDRIEAIVPAALVPGLLISIPAFFGTLVFSSEILGLVFGDAYTIASVALIILMGEKILQSFYVVFGRSLRAINREDLSAKSTIVSIVANLILTFVLVPLFGLSGAAIATAVSFGLNTILHAVYLSEFISIRFPIVEVGWALVAAITMTISLLALRHVLPIQTLVELLLVISLGALTYTVVLLLFPPLRKNVIVQAKHILDI